MSCDNWRFLKLKLSCSEIDFFPKDNDPMQLQDLSTELPIVAKRVRSLMLRNGISARQLSTKLTEILNISYSHAHRKMTTDLDWRLSELEMVAKHFNETLSILMLDEAEGIDSGHSIDEFDSYEALFSIGVHEVPCKILVGEILHNPHNIALVAMHDDAGLWRIIEPAAAVENRPVYDLRRIEIIQNRVSKLSIAVLDDDENTADNIRDYLVHVGFQATAFYTVKSAIEALSENEYDAFIMDWFVGRETSEELLKTIRSSYAVKVPIILLTGQLVTGKVNDTEVAQLMRRYDVFCQEKPSRLPIIVAELSKLLGLR